jgi:hypothetical protein
MGFASLNPSYALQVWDGRWRNRKKFAILFGMRVTKQILAFLLAAALMAGGTVRGMAAPEACPPAHHGDSQSMHAEHHSHGDNHDHAGDHAHHHHSDKKQEPSHKSCLECCGICVTATSGLSAAPSFSVHRFGSLISYSLKRGVWSSQNVLVDPGIPKRIV